LVVAIYTHTNKTAACAVLCCAALRCACLEAVAGLGVSLHRVLVLLPLAEQGEALQGLYVCVEGGGCCVLRL
jgi:hypothetical protein